MSHLLVDLGWVAFDLGFHHLAQPLLPNSHQPRQNWADRGTLKIQVNITQSTRSLVYKGWLIRDVFGTSLFP